MTIRIALRAALLGVAAAGVLAAPAVRAQTTTIIEGPTGSIDEGYEFAPEQETVIRRRIIDERLAPVEIQGGTVRVGSIVPDYVELQAMNGIGSPRLQRLGYFLSPDDKIVVVEPRTRQVVRIIDQR